MNEISFLFPLLLVSPAGIELWPTERLTFNARRIIRAAACKIKAALDRFVGAHGGGWFLIELLAVS
ncbi:hypothetical protein KHP62_05010 [Rhodobacteraceae bacterium NNCM2]|nr:hypothetical protein [Coraliihabitans acroporae]